MIERRIVRSACIRHGSPGNSSIDLVGSRMRLIFVESYKDDIEVRCSTRGSEEVLEPVPGKCYTSVVAVILNIGLRQKMSQLMGCNRGK